MPGTPEQAGVVSANNSTSSTLTANSVFTGTSDEVTGYATVSVFIFADQVSATDGLSVQWSSNNINWDDTDTYTIPASTGKIFTFGVQSRYMRAVYTNGAVNQGAFRLQTIFHNVLPKPSSHRIKDTLTGENDGELQLATTFGRRADGSFYPLVATSGNALYVAPVDSRTVTGSFSWGSPTISGSASNQTLASIENPSASTINVYLKRIELQGYPILASATPFLYHIGRSSGLPSGGAVATVQQNRTANSSAVAVVRVIPTVTSASNDMATISPGLLLTSSGTVFPLQYGFGEEKRPTDDIVLAPGEGLGVKADANTTNWRHSVDFVWDEGIG